MCIYSVAKNTHARPDKAGKCGTVHTINGKQGLPIETRLAHVPLFARLTQQHDNGQHVVLGASAASEERRAAMSRTISMHARAGMCNGGMWVPASVVTRCSQGVPDSFRRERPRLQLDHRPLNRATILEHQIVPLVLAHERGRSPLRCFRHTH